MNVSRGALHRTTLKDAVCVVYYVMVLAGLTIVHGKQMGGWPPWEWVMW